MSGHTYIPRRNPPLILAALKERDGQTLLELFTSLGVGRDGLMNAVNYLETIGKVRKEQMGELGAKTHFRVWLIL